MFIAPILFMFTFLGTQLERKTRPWHCFSSMWHLISDQWWRRYFFTAQLPIDVLPTQYQFTAFLRRYRSMWYRYNIKFPIEVLSTQYRSTTFITNYVVTDWHVWDIMSNRNVFY